MVFNIKILKLQAMSILGAFAKLGKATISFVMSHRLSIRPSACPHGTTRLPLEGFSLILIIFFKSVEKIEASLTLLTPN